MIPLTKAAVRASFRPLAEWNTPSFHITLIAADSLRAWVRSHETGDLYLTKVEAPSMLLSHLSVLQEAIQDNFYVRVIQSQNIPCGIELYSRGVGGGKFYKEKNLPLLPQGNASLNSIPKTARELVWVMQRLQKGDSRYTLYLSKASLFIQEFISNPASSKDKLQDFVILVIVGDKDLTRAIIEHLIDRIKNSILLNLDFVHALADAIDRASPAHLNADDLIQLMRTLFDRVQKTHSKGAEQSQEAQLKSFCRILAAMIDANVCDIPREKQIEVRTFLEKLSDSDSQTLQCYAAYALEALNRLPNDETKLAAIFRRATGVFKGVYCFYTAINTLNPDRLVEGFFALKENIGDFIRFAKEVKDTIVDAVSDLQEGASSLREAFESIPRLRWYEQIRYVEWLIASNAFPALESLLFDSRVQRERFFVYLLAEKLHEVVLLQPDLTLRKNTLHFLQHLYREDKMWSDLDLTEDHYKNEAPTGLLKRDTLRMRLALKALLISRFQSYTQISELRQESLEALHLLTQRATPEERKFIERYRQGPIEAITSPTSSTSLMGEKTSEKFTLEAKLEKIQSSIINDPAFQGEKPLYVPLMGAPFEGSEVVFDLRGEVQKFLQGDQRVLLLLGNSGSGKSFFSKILAFDLWQVYKPATGEIPLYISLPSVKDPIHKLVPQALKKYGLNEDEINELKENRNIVFILDGYDEIPKNSDILEENQLLDFKGKIIVTCRPEALSSTDIFVPVLGGKPKQSLLKELHLSPFSSEQIDYFIQKCIDLGNTEWKDVARYKQAIQGIPGLQELVQTPFILKIITDTLPEIIDQHKTAEGSHHLSLTRYALYGAFMDEWFKKGFGRVKKQLNQLQAVGLGPKNIIKEATQFCIRLANVFVQKGQTHIQYDEFSPDPELEPLLGNNTKSVHLRSMAPLKVTQDGIYSFLHKSLLEYFIALGIKNILTSPSSHVAPASAPLEIAVRPSPQEAQHSPISRTENIPPLPKPNLIATFKGVPIFDKLLESSIWFFLADNVKTDRGLQQEFFSLIEQSKTNPQMAIAAANAISILNLANVTFSGRDFKGIRIPGAYLEKTSLLRCNLQNADLSGSNLTGTVLSYAELEGANMEGVQFGQLPFIQAAAPVECMIVSLDGKFLIEGCKNNIYIRDIQSRKSLKTLEGHTDNITALVVLSDGKLLASASDDKTIRIWDLESGKTLKILAGHKDKVNALLLLNGGQQIASASSDKTIRVWDLESGKTLKILEGHTNSVHAIVLFNEGKYLASAGADKTIRIWHLESEKTLKTLFVENKLEIYALALLNGGKHLASAGSGSNIEIWDLDSGKLLKILRGHTTQVNALLLFDGGKYLVSAGRDKSILIWDLEAGKVFKTLEGYSGWVKALAVLDGGKKLASAGTDKTIRIWNLESEKPLKTREGHTGWISALALLNGENLLASGSGDHTLRIWELDSGKQLKTLKGPKLVATGLIKAFMLLNGGRYLASAGLEHAIRIWELETGKTIKILEGHTKLVCALALFNGGKYLVSGSADKTIRIWELESGKTIKILEGSAEECYALLVLNGGKHLVSAGNGSDIRIWDIEAGKTIKMLKGHTQKVMALALLNDGKHLVSGSWDNTIRIWNLETGAVLKILEGHTDNVNSLLLLSGENHLASASSDKTIRIWDVKSGCELCKIVHPFAPIGLSFKQPNFLVVGDVSGGIWYWKLNLIAGNYQPQLLWATNPSLICTDVKLGNVRQLSNTNRDLMLQYGARE